MKREIISQMAIKPGLIYGSKIYSHKLHSRNNTDGRSFTRLASLFLLTLFMGYNSIAFSQSSPPPPPEGHGSQGNQAPHGSTAPIGSGTLILIGLAALYGGRKLHILKNEEKE